MLQSQLGCSADVDLASRPHPDLFPELTKDAVKAAADKEPDFSLDELTQTTVGRLCMLAWSCQSPVLVM